MSKLAHSHQPSMDLIEAKRIAADMTGMDDEANQFAAHLLVPESFLIAELAKMGGVKDIDDEQWLTKLAKKFRVSRGMMQYRLRLHAVRG